MANRIITTLSLIAAGILSCQAMASTESHTFTPSQQKEIGSIIRSYLVSHPEVLVEASRALQQKQQAQVLEQAQGAIKKNADALFKSGPVAGNAQGDINIVEFFDYQCVHCKEMAPVLSKLSSTDKNIRIVYKELPIFGGTSQYAAAAALAANNQGKYTAFHDALMSTSQGLSKDVVLSVAKKVGLNTKQLEQDINSEKIKTQLADNMRLADELGLRGTPAFVIAQNKANSNAKSFFLPGTVNLSMLQSFIKELRTQ